MRRQAVILLASAGLLFSRNAGAEQNFEYGQALCAVRGFSCVYIREIFDRELLQVGEEKREVKVRWFTASGSGARWQGKRFMSLPRWEDVWPDSRERAIVMHLNRMNVPLKVGSVIAVPDSMDGKTLLDFSPFPQRRESAGQKQIIWDPALLAWGAYDAGGVLVRWGAGVGGMNKCPEPELHGRSCRTIVGTFRVLRKEGPDARSSKYPLGCSGDECASIPWIMIFEDSGYGFHCSVYDSVQRSGGLPGHNASHGCVRLFCEDAEWLNSSFVDMPAKGKRGTQVIILPYPLKKETPKPQ